MSLIKKTTTTKEYIYDQEVLVREIETIIEEQYNQDLTIYPSYPSYPVTPNYPWTNPIWYGPICTTTEATTTVQVPLNDQKDIVNYL